MDLLKCIQNCVLSILCCNEQSILLLLWELVRYNELTYLLIEFLRVGGQGVLFSVFLCHSITSKHYSLSQNRLDIKADHPKHKYNNKRTQPSKNLSSPITLKPSLPSRINGADIPKSLSAHLRAPL